jgi:hypothetical protein
MYVLEIAKCITQAVISVACLLYLNMDDLQQKYNSFALLMSFSFSLHACNTGREVHTMN